MWQVILMVAMEDKLGDEFLNTFYVNFMLLRPNVCCSYTGAFCVCRNVIFFSGLVWNVLQLSLRNWGGEVVDSPLRGTFVIFIYNKNVQSLLSVMIIIRTDDDVEKWLKSLLLLFF
jgi:hypothetical protein